MFDRLSDRLDKAFKILKGQGSISEINIAETTKEIRRALLDADVNFKIAKEFTDKVKDEALGREVIKSVNPGQMMTKIVHDELVQLMGAQKTDLDLNGQPCVILMAGLQGSGKTTFTAKLARHLKGKGRKVMMAACDVYRPAAIDQLQTLGEQIDVPVYARPGDENPLKIARDAVKEAKDKGYQILLVDTAGRQSVDERMMDEIAGLKKELNPKEILFVVDAMTGQDAVNTAQAFNQVLDFTGVILTKLDGDTRGGAALSIRYTTGKPIKFVGTGEKVDALDIFYPERMAGRILGMGDVVSLVERAQERVDEEEAARIRKKIHQNKFDLEDFMNQIQQIRKMGNIKDLMGMIPGMGKAVKDLDMDDSHFTRIEAIIRSMTPTERAEPELINGSRRQRIARGSGSDITEVNRLLKQFQDMKKMMSMMKKMGPMNKMMAGLKGGGSLPGGLPGGGKLPGLN